MFLQKVQRTLITGVFLFCIADAIYRQNMLNEVGAEEDDYSYFKRRHITQDMQPMQIRNNKRRQNVKTLSKPSSERKHNPTIQSNGIQEGKREPIGLDLLLLCPIISWYIQFLFYVYSLNREESEEDEHHGN